VLIYTRDVKDGGLGDPNITWNKAWKYPARVRFTPNGTDVIDWTDMPLKECFTGAVSGYDESTMVCPMWDGQHSLYRSVDYGRSWQRAGLIASNSKPPDESPDPNKEQYMLADFAVITYLRNNSVPANMSPLTPWLSDSNYKSPIL
jgi:hypothetical protein